jgi:arsenate reductase
MKALAQKQKILFVCTHNSARSHMAEGLVNAFYGDRLEAQSAGTEPSQVNPLAVRIMAEIGIDISGHHSKGVEEFLDQDFEYVVTVCDHANETCPFFPGGKERIHRGFKDPAAVEGNEDEKLAVFRQVRDEIRNWVKETFAVRV